LITLYGSMSSPSASAGARPGRTRRVVAPTVAATHAVADALAAFCRAGDVVVLAGEMGAGKTAFAQGLGRSLGVTEPITSPTFTLVQTYRGADHNGRRVDFHHADLYRLDQLAEVAELAFGELAEFGGIVVVEWGDVVAATLGEHLSVRLERADDDDDDRRVIIVEPAGPTWAQRWDRIAAALDALPVEKA